MASANTCNHKAPGHYAQSRCRKRQTTGKSTSASALRTLQGRTALRRWHLWDNKPARKMSEAFLSINHGVCNLLRVQLCSLRGFSRDFCALVRLRTHVGLPHLRVRSVPVATLMRSPSRTPSLENQNDDGKRSPARKWWLAVRCMSAVNK